MTPMKLISKPVAIEAVQLLPGIEVPWNSKAACLKEGVQFDDEAKKLTHMAEYGDWLVRYTKTDEYDILTTAELFHHYRIKN